MPPKLLGYVPYVYADVHCGIVDCEVQEASMLSQTKVKSLALAPAIEVMYNRFFTTPCDDPCYLLIAIIYLLVFCKGWNQGKIARCKLLSLRPVGPTNNRAVTFGRIDNCVWLVSD